LTSFFWSLAADDLYLGSAPIFLDDKYIYFTNKSRGGYGVVLYDLRLRSAKTIFQDSFRIEKMGLHANELICARYDHGEVHYRVTNLINNASEAVAEFNIPSRYAYELLPKSNGIIYLEKICIGDVCYYRIVIDRTSGPEILEDHIVNSVYSGPVVSKDEKYFGFSTVDGTRITDILSARQVIFSEGNLSLYNVDSNNNFLGFSLKESCFFLLNPSSPKTRRIQLPKEFQTRRVYIQTAALSPQATYIAYGIQGEVRGTTADMSLVLQHVDSGVYRTIAKRAKIFAIAWSDIEQYISITGVEKRDLFDIGYMYKMKNTSTQDKEILDTEGKVIFRSSDLRTSASMNEGIKKTG
jgi:hypothetical protein